MIEQLPTVAFWISVSGTDDKESFGYLLETNLRIEGRSESVVRSLIAEWRRGNEIFRKGGSFEENQRATGEATTGPLLQVLLRRGGDQGGAICWRQKTFIAEHHPFDEASGLMIYVPGFRQILKAIRCPVLALFGEKDSVVDWRSTMALYKETIGSGVDADLTIKTFPGCNHNMLQCRTCGRPRGPGDHRPASVLRRLPGRDHHVDQGEGRPRYPGPWSGRPGRAAVSFPSSTTSWPLTAT